MRDSDLQINKNQHIWSQAGLVFAAVSWGSTFFLLKNMVADTHPLTITGWRFLIAALLLGLFLSIQKKRLWADLRFGGALSFLVVLVYAPQAIGLQFTSATNSGFITGLFVAFVPFFAWAAFKKTPEVSKFIAVAVALIGLWFLTGGLDQINIGDLLTLITAVTYALHLLFTGILVKKIDPIVLTFQQFLFAGLACLLLAVGSGVDLQIGSTYSLFGILYLALIPTLAALVIQAIAQKHVSAIKTAIIFCLEPVFAALFAWTIGGEALTMPQAIGGSLIFAAMLIAETNLRGAYRKRR